MVDPSKPNVLFAHLRLEVAAGDEASPQATGPAENTVCLSSSPRPRRGRFRRPLGFGRCSSRRASLRRTTLSTRPVAAAVARARARR